MWAERTVLKTGQKLLSLWFTRQSLNLSAVKKKKRSFIKICFFIYTFIKNSCKEVIWILPYYPSSVSAVMIDKTQYFCFQVIVISSCVCVCLFFPSVFKCRECKVDQAAGPRAEKWSQCIGAKKCSSSNGHLKLALFPVDSSVNMLKCTAFTGGLQLVEKNGLASMHSFPLYNHCLWGELTCLDTCEGWKQSCDRWTESCTLTSANWIMQQIILLGYGVIFVLSVIAIIHTHTQ